LSCIHTTRQVNSRTAPKPFILAGQGKNKCC
jgi:hypothetical protein